jgi:hypothetical protein
MHPRFGWQRILASAASGAVLYAFASITFHGAATTFHEQATGTVASASDSALGGSPGMLVAYFVVPLVLSSLLQGGAWARSSIRSALVGAWPVLAFYGYLFLVSLGRDVEMRGVPASFFCGVMLSSALAVAAACGFLGGRAADLWLGTRAIAPLFGIRWFHYLWILPTLHYYLLTAILIYFAALDSLTYGFLADDGSVSIGDSFVLIGGGITLFGARRLLELHHRKDEKLVGRTIFFGPILAIVGWLATYAAHRFRIFQGIGEHAISSNWTLVSMLLFGCVLVAIAAYLARPSERVNGATIPPRFKRSRRPTDLSRRPKRRRDEFPVQHIRNHGRSPNERSSALSQIVTGALTVLLKSPGGTFVWSPATIREWGKQHASCGFVAM